MQLATALAFSAKKKVKNQSCLALDFERFALFKGSLQLRTLINLIEVPRDVDENYQYEEEWRFVDTPKISNSKKPERIIVVGDSNDVNNSCFHN